jgi:formate hydrogenlyase subunit 4
VTTKLSPGLFPGDVIMLVYVLALGRFFMMLSGLDTGSTFGGMGSSREAMISSLMEPSILVTVFSIGLVAGTTSVYGIMQVTRDMALPLLQPVFILAALTLILVILAETSRIPVDDPATHLELTMVHEAMILEYSGRHLALIEWAASMKFFIFLALLANLFVPWGVALTLNPMALSVALLTLLIKLAVLAAIVAVIETRVAKLRLFRVPELLSVSFLLALLAVASSFMVR